MYLRYGDLSWDTPESQDGASAPVPAHPASAGSAPSGPSGNGAGSVHSVHPGGSHLPTIDLHGVRLHAVTEVTAIRHLLDELGAGRGGLVVTPNLDHLRRCSKDVNFAALVAEAELVVADGMPLVWASRIQGTPLPERVAGSNLISSLSEAAAVRGRSVFLLGGAPGTADGAAKVLAKRFPGLKIAGTYCPPVGFERNTRVMGELHNRLTASKADIVFVALGSPKQEKLIQRLRPLLPVAWWLGVGNSFSFLCGHVRRAPLWMQKCGLEWLHRLSQEPRRLFKRYVVVGLPFGARLLGRAAWVGLSNKLSGRRPNGDGGRVIPNPPASSAPGPDSGAAPTPAAASAPEAPGVSARTESTLAVSSSAAIPINVGRPQAPSAAGNRLSRLRALVLLGGSVRPSALAAAADRSVLDLPLDENGSLLNFWLSQAKEVARSTGLDALPVRVMVNQASPEPYSADERFYGTFRVERDRSEYRGTAGVLRDLAADYGDDDLVLVSNAAQVLLDPLASIVAALESKGGDIGVVSHEDGTPSGVMLITCKTLRDVADTGYVDMKEQALPKIASQFDVRVLRRRRPTGVPIRTLDDYVRGLRFHHRLRAGKPVISDPLAEDWSPAFSLTEAGAIVGAGARVHDSVVLAGGEVEPGAVVVRSVVCPGGFVRKDRTAVDEFITGGGRPHSSGAVSVPPVKPLGARAVASLVNAVPGVVTVPGAPIVASAGI